MMNSYDLELTLTFTIQAAHRMDREAVEQRIIEALRDTARDLSNAKREDAGALSFRWNVPILRTYHLPEEVS